LKVFILTEGGKKTGYGHITRSLSLWEAFREKQIIPTLVVNGDKTVGELLNNTVYDVFDWMDEQDRLYGTMHGAEIVIVDSYLADLSLYKRISDIAAVPVYIDDCLRLNYPRGVVVNGAVDSEGFDYSEHENITYLLGSRYIPLRKEFWQVPEKKINKQIETVLITLGGHDLKNMTRGVLETLVRIYPKITKHVVIGKGFENIKRIKDVADKRTHMIFQPDPKKMQEIMLESDISISAAGQTLYELARQGVPAIAITVANNQHINIKNCQKAGFIEYAGWWENKDILDNLIKRIKILESRELRQERSENGKAMVDGLGAERIARFCFQKYFDETLVLKLATLDDVHNIYSLSTESFVRQNSFHREKFSFEEHKKWFIEKLRDEDCFFIISEIGGKFIGQIRFDVAKKEAVISISIVERYRGIGVGNLIIQKALQYLRIHNPQIEKIKAFIKNDNVSSIKLFQNANFKYEKKLVIEKHNAVEYIYHLRQV
jgi:spore coat polysaccharide biosynthesis predicted glycosyltransferase SpsG/L-amino acid N-acyltransferase YncA